MSEAKDPIPPILSQGAYPAILEKEITVKIRLCSPDVVNAYGRDKGLNVQAVAVTDNLAGIVLVSWPPKKPHLEDGTINPDFEYGMDERSLLFALGYEIYSNVCHFDTDPLGRS